MMMTYLIVKKLRYLFALSGDRKPFAVADAP
jgi:hypothetical protein